MQFHRPHSHPVAVNCYGDKTVAWEPDKTVIHHPAPIMSSSFLPFTLYRLNGTKLFIILQLLTYLHRLTMDTEAGLSFQSGKKSWMNLYYVYCLHLLEQTRALLLSMVSLHQLKWSVTPKVKLILNSRSKKLSLVAVKGEIIWRTHSISFPGYLNANEAHLYNLSKWKADNRTPSLYIHFQRASVFLMDEDHLKRRQTGKQNTSCCATKTKTLIFKVYLHLSNAHNSI